MGQLDQFAADVAGTVADLEAQAGALNERRQKLHDRGNQIMGRWAQHFDAQEQAIAATEAALNRISNVPLTTTPAAKPATIPLSEEHK